MRILKNPTGSAREEIEAFYLGPDQEVFAAFTSTGKLLGWVTFEDRENSLHVDWVTRKEDSPPGTGKKLLSKVIGEARKRGKEYVSLFPDPETLIPYYKRLGFSPEMDRETQKELDEGDISMQDIEMGEGLLSWRYPVK